MSAWPDAPSVLRVLVTRPSGTWPSLAGRFAGTTIAIEMGATTTQVEPLDPRPGDAAVLQLDTYDWLVATSGQGVKALILKLAARGRHGWPERLRVAVVGPATARAFEGAGARVELVAAEAHSEGLAASLRPRLQAGERVLLVRPEGAPGLLAPALRAQGAHVDEAPLYRTVPAAAAPRLAEEAIAGRFAAVAFTAPSSLDLWLDAAGPRRKALVDALARAKRVAIGPATASHLEAAGLPPDAVAASPDETAIGDAIARVLGGANC
jgi:uroporphyrinogen III methyltransferase / synthase